VEYFLIDPPHVVDLDELEIPRRHPCVRLRTGTENVYDIYDVVGKEYYPDVAAFVEEARFMGVSRRCELNDYSMLTAESKMVLIHPHAWIDNFVDYYAAFNEAAVTGFRCPKVIGSKLEPRRLHELPVRPADGVMCAGLWYHDHKPRKKDEEDWGPRVIELPGGDKYQGFSRPEGVVPQYQTAIFAIFPLGAFEVVADPVDRAHEQKLRKLQSAQVPVAVVEE
jgi:hypothetical protein